MEKLLANLRHWQTTALGFAVLAATALNSKTVTDLAAMNPKAAHYVGIVAGIAASAVAVLGMGGNQPAADQPAANTNQQP